MSDLRLEDLRLVQCLPSCEVDHDRMVPTHHRPVTRVEVLEALGAEKRWWCHDPKTTAALSFRPRGGMTILAAAGCGWWTMSDMCAVHDSYRCTIHIPACADCVRHCQYASFDGVEGDCRFPKPALAEASDIGVVDDAT